MWVWFVSFSLNCFYIYRLLVFGILYRLYKFVSHCFFLKIYLSTTPSTFFHFIPLLYLLESLIFFLQNFSLFLPAMFEIISLVLTSILLIISWAMSRPLFDQAIEVYFYFDDYIINLYKFFGLFLKLLGLFFYRFLSDIFNFICIIILNICLIILK